MYNKRNFIKREHSNDKKIPTIKDTYDGISKEKINLRKDEPFVLMFRNFIFFDVKSYECRNGDLYIRNIVDGIILKRYFRMGGDDQLTVFKNRAEFDEFMKNVEKKGYLLGPDKHIEFEKGRNWYRGYRRHAARKEEREYYKGDGVSYDFIRTNWSICDNTSLNGRVIKSKVTDQFVLEDTEPELVDKVCKVLQGNEQEDSESGIHCLLKQASDNFILENFTAIRNSETGKIDVITSTWDGYSVTREESPEFFDDVVRVFEANPGSAQILTKNDFM